MGSSVSKQGLTESGVPTGSWVVHLIQAPRTPPVKTFQRFLPANSRKKTNDYICTMKWLLAGGKSTYTHKTVLNYVGACTSPRACWNFMQNLEECMLFYGEGIHNFYQSQKGPTIHNLARAKDQCFKQMLFFKQNYYNLPLFLVKYLMSWDNMFTFYGRIFSNMGFQLSFYLPICSPPFSKYGFTNLWSTNDPRSYYMAKCLISLKSF